MPIYFNELRPFGARRKHCRRGGRANLVAFFTPSILAAALFATSETSIAGTAVVPDGRTQTSIASAGNTMDVTTATIKNGNAFNSFSQFQVGEQSTVNLHVPDSAQRLLNVVHGGPVQIDGVVNGYKNGSIGGDVYFADPYGFVVGAKGAINVGSLTVRTPTQSATENIIDQNGNLNDQATSDVVNGTMPISPDGAVSILGKITAPGGVHITAQSVTTAAQTNQAASSSSVSQSQAFTATVNTTGLQQGGAIVADGGGNIDITTASDTTIGGVLSANGASGNAAGTITMNAGGNITLGAGTQITAKGNGTSSDGGHVKTMAGQGLNVSGASIDVSAGDSGNGGTIELSAKGAANIAGVTFNVTAPFGTAGSILIDPADVTITNVSSLDIPADQASINSNGGNVTITADNSITIEKGAYINTRWTDDAPGAPAITAKDGDITTVPKGKSGDVSLTAPSITIAGDINTFSNVDGSTTFADGNITITASQNPTNNPNGSSKESGKATADTAIDISGALDGGTIDVEANSTAIVKYDTLDQVMVDLGSSFLGLGAGYVDARATTAITVDTGASIKGSGDVTLNSWTNATAEDPAMTLAFMQAAGFGSPVVTSVVVGNVTATAKTTVATGATIDSGGAVTVRAHNTDMLDVNSFSISSATPVDATVTYTTADVESTANVAEGATIKNAQNVAVVARNDNSFSNQATVVALGTGTVGVVVALADGYTSSANAHFGPSATLTGGTGQNLKVEADSITTKDATSASSTVGSNLFLRAITPQKAANALSGVQGKFTTALSILANNQKLIKFGGAVALTLGDDQSATATLGGDATQAPTINAQNVAVIANTQDLGVRSNANSAVNAPSIADATPADPAAKFSFSAGVSLADRSLTADAEIGSGAAVNAANIGVNATTNLPVTITWLDGDSFQDVMSHINANLGLANDVLTTFTDSTADAGKGGIAGSVDLFNVNANTTAFVGQGAKLKSTNAGGSWSVALDSGDDDAHGGLDAADASGESESSGDDSQHAQQEFPPAQLTFASPISVTADRTIATLNAAGNLSIFLSGIGSNNQGGVVFGATFDMTNYGGSTVAGIGADATVSTDGSAGLTVAANADDKAITISPAAGNGEGVGVSGMVSLFKLDTSVHASIAASAAVTAPAVDLSAQQGENIATVSGSVLVGDSNNVGAMETTNTIDTDVRAYVGDNGADDPTQSASSIPNFTAPASPGVTSSGGSASNAITIASGESGIVQSLAIAFDAGTNANLGAAVSVNTINDSVTASVGDSANLSATDVYVAANAGDTIHTIAMGVGGSTEGAGLAGSSVAAKISPTVLATIAGAATVTADDNVGVTATNGSEIDSIAGAAGLGSMGGGGLSIVVDQIGGSTTASIAEATVDAKGTTAGDTFNINTGALANPIDVSSISDPTARAPSLAETTESVSGLAVDATSTEAIVSNGVTIGAGGKSISAAIMPVTNIVSGSTDATIEFSQIDTNLTGNPLSKNGYNPPAIDVIASDHSYADNWVAAIAAGSGNSGAGAVATDQYQRTTDAHSLDTNIGTSSDGVTRVGVLDIAADGSQDASIFVIGGSAGGMSGGAASLAVTLFSATTQGYLEGDTTVVGALDVTATSDNGANVFDGAAALSTGATGVGGSIAVTINNDNTLAFVGDRTHIENGSAAAATTLDVTGITNVIADTTNDLPSLLIAGAGGGEAGIAADADVTTLSNTTKSGIYGTTMNGSPAAASGNINVLANESDTIVAKAGGGDASFGFGIGIAANVVVLHSSVTSTILDSSINSAGAVDVWAQGDKNITALTVTGSVGATAGIDAAIGVVLAGTNASGDVQGQLNQNGSGTLASVQSNVDGVSPGNDIAGSANAGSPDAITASIAGGSIAASSIFIDSEGKASTSNQAVGVAAGGYAGVGGAVAYTDLGDTVLASLDSASVTVPNVSIDAGMSDLSDHAVSTEADAGGGGAFGLGAGIAIGKDSSTVAAQFQGTATGDTTGAFNLGARDSSSMSSTAAGGAAGGVAIGIMAATATKQSNVNADTLASASLANYSDASLAATDGGSVSASATGVAGGTFGAGAGAGTNASDTANVNARLGDHTKIVGDTGIVDLSAQDTPNVGDESIGVAVSDGASLGISVALAKASPTVTATLGDGVSISGSGGLQLTATAEPVANGDTAEAIAYSGAGGTLAGLDGAGTNATDSAYVAATTGTNVVLPDGDVGIVATNISNQHALASGVGVGGLAGGASDAVATSNGTVIATLADGASASTLGAHTGALTVEATGNDTNDSHAVAGTYGLVAGNASIASTTDNGSVDATIGDGVSLTASTITVQATHQDNYAEFGDSTEVSVLGASGAGATHDSTVTVNACVGGEISAANACVNGSAGHLGAACFDVSSTTCLEAFKTLSVIAENDFTRIGTDDAAEAGGGGVLNGAGATSTTNLGGTANVVIADSATLTSGSDPILNPGQITLLADSAIKGTDTVSLSTGGALEGSGTTNDYTATVDNNVSIGQNDVLLSFGNIDAGTFTTTNIEVQALGSTWGILGAVANADTTTNVTTDQTLTVATGASLLSYGNINLTPGQDSATARQTAMEAESQAETYVHGFVAIPDAHANEDVTNNATLSLAATSVVDAGENATIGAYTGTLTPSADGTGHGYELGFIPVTDGGNRADPHTSSVVKLDGKVTAGAFNNIAITIPESCGDPAPFCSQMQVQGGFTESFNLAPIAANYRSRLPSDFIPVGVTGHDRSLLESGMSSTPVDVVAFGSLFASPGIVTVNADTISGGGTVTSNAGASITINNDSGDYLALSQIKIADIPGGDVLFTGKIDETAAKNAGISVVRNTADNGSNISVTDTYAGAVGNVPDGPGIFAGGAIENLGGTVSITDATGSLGQFSSIVAQTVNIAVPQGVLLVDLTPDILESTGASVQSDWEQFMVFPGGDPALVTPSPTTAVAYAVNAVYNSSGGITDATFNGNLIRTTDGKGSDGATLVVYGACLPTDAGNSCGGGDGASESPLHAFTTLDSAFPGFNCGCQGPGSVPTEQLQNDSSTNISAANQTQASALTANKISITATYVNIDSDVIAGPPASWSIYLPSAVASTIATDQANFNANKTSSPDFVLSGTSVTGAADALIKATYVAGAATPGNTVDGNIVLDDVLASSQEPASIYINGGILSTNTLGHLHVNAGLGQVNIDNQTGVPITVGNIAAGSSNAANLKGTIEIIDTLKPVGDVTNPDHFLYVYTPGVGTQVFSSTDPNAAPVTPVSDSAATSFTYKPQADMRWGWTQYAFLSRSFTPNANGDGNPIETTTWHFTTPDGSAVAPNDPWYFVHNASVIDPAEGTTYSYQGQTLTQDPAHTGILLPGQDTTLPFEESITGSVGIGYVDAINSTCMFLQSAHCHSQAQSSDFVNFQSTSGTCFGFPCGWWDFDYVTSATLKLTTSVKADNPIAIDFSGGTRGSVVVNSDAPVTINGQIVNSNGDTSISATGAIVTTTSGLVNSDNLTLTSGDTIGSSAAKLQTIQTSGGVLDASATNGVYLNGNTPLNVGTISAPGHDVVLSALGNLTTANSNLTNITGGNVTLTATGGAIGISGAPIKTDITGTFDATADGNINIEQVSGDLAAGAVKSNSASGVVTIAVDQGALVDAAQTTAVQTLSSDQVQNIWKALKLTAATGANANVGAAAPTVTGIANTVDTDYTQYWLLLAHGSVQGGNFVLDPASAALFAAAAAAQGMTPGVYAASLYNKTVADFVQYVGQNWQSQAAFQARDPNFQFAPSQAQIDSLSTGAVWTDDELKSVLSLTGLKPASSIDLGSVTPNVSGGTLSLSTANGVGSLAAPIAIDINKLKAGQLTPDQEAALALARNPGDLLFVGTDQNGQTITFSGIVPPPGVQITGVTIKQTAPLFVDTNGPLSASATQGGVFVQETQGALQLGLINAAGGSVNLAAPGDIVATTPGPAPVIDAAHIALLSSSGNLGGGPGAPLVFTGGMIDTAAAAQGISLEASAGNFVVGKIVAGTDVTLKAPAGSILQAASGISIEGHNLTLETTGGDIGSGAQPLTFQLSTGGALDGNATGSVTLDDAGAALHVTSLVAGGDLTLLTVNDLTADSLQSGGNVMAASGGNATFGQVQGQGNVSLSALGDLSLDQATSGGAFDVNAGQSVTIDGNGFITSGGALSLTSGAAITMGVGSALSAGGDLTLSSAGDAMLSTLTSGGAVAITSNGVLTMGAGSKLSAANDVDLNIAGDASLTNASAGGNANISTGGALGLGTLTAGGAATITAGGGVSLADGGTVASGGALAITEGSFLAMGTHSLISGGGPVSITVAGDASLSTVESAFNGDHAVSISADRIAGNGDGATNIIARGADARVYLSAQSGIGDQSTFLNVDTPSLAPMTASGGLFIHALSNIQFADISAPADMQISGDGSLAFSSVTAAGALVLDAANDVTFGTIASQGDITATAGNALSGGSLTGVGLTLVAGPGLIAIDHITGATLDLKSRGDLVLTDVRVADQATFSAPNVKVDLTQTASSGPLNVDILGVDGASAGEVTLHAVTSNGLQVGILSAHNAAITTTADDVAIAKGRIEDQMFLITPKTNLYLNDNSPTPIANVTEQFYAPGKTFFLTQTGTDTVTDAFAVNFGPDNSVTTIDANGVPHQGMTLANTAPLPLSASDWGKEFVQQDLAATSAIALGPLWVGALPNLSLFDQWVQGIAGGAVNTNDKNQ